MKKVNKPDTTYSSGKTDFGNLWVKGIPPTVRVPGFPDKGYIEIEDLTYKVNILDENGNEVTEEYDVILTEKSIKDLLGILGKYEWKNDYKSFIKEKMAEAFENEPKRITKQGERVYSCGDMDFYMVLGLTKRIIRPNV